ncbi:deoxyribodipyrimidine photolyase [Maribacter sp. 4U21]|uniref:DASH family cryptochrome n=1 Tax=Maribacter sp. 4U21 TaxID=1889779 RepID=UPI000C15C017|nr:DASH family cryptochrome [Maribacter sp. 4U21]PIB22928.1 deoxyribodipyrimidine photolyase [Maribacter sp. 4U21]
MNNLIWFRNDLRVTDNESLIKAMNGKKVIAVYCFDPRHYEVDNFGFKKTEKYRAKFLMETITNLRANLKQLNVTLFVFHDKPEVVLPKLVKENEINNIFLQKEWTPEEIDVFDAVIASVPALVNFDESFGQFLFHPDDIPYDGFEKIPDVFTTFRKKCEKYVQIKSIYPSPEPKEPTNLIETTTKIPTLHDLGLRDFSTDSRTAFPFQGGEDEANNRIASYFWKTEKLAYYKKTRNGLIGKDYSSKLSAWLANGSISARTIYWQVKKFEKEVIKNQDTYWLIFELIWRDYFKYVSLKHQNKIFYLGGILNADYQWENSIEAKENWIKGNTKEPFVNANMKELALTGWMSNRGRQNVASFWSKELEQDWRVGAAYFESMLIDYDVHSNWGNWMYNSGVGNDPRNRRFNIPRQASMYDANGKFQKLWLQETLF